MTTERPLHVCFVMLYYAPGRRLEDPASYLAETPIHRALPQALAARGHRIDVVHLAPRDLAYCEAGVRYHFVASPALVRGAARLAGRLAGRDPSYWEPAWSAIRRVRDLEPDVVHVHGLTLNLNLGLLRRGLGPGTPMVLHYHGGYPSRQRLVRRVQRANLDRAGRACFTTRAHAEPFLRAGLLSDAGRIVELVETSSTFQPRDRPAARAETGMTGDPVFVWAGRLHPIKDPLTALRGFERILAGWPAAQLYMHYLTDECLPNVRAFLAERPTLAAHVHLRGRAPFAAMETIFNSADFLLQASRREFGGCAVLEAMACGVIPVITDIPSFRMMTDDGRAGILFPVGDDAELARQVLALPRAEIPQRARDVRAWFDRSLSFTSMAHRLEALYTELTSPAPRLDPVGTVRW